MKLMIRIVDQTDVMVDGSFEDIVMQGATAASALCCKDRQVVRFYIFEGYTKTLMYQNSVSYTNE